MHLIVLCHSFSLQSTTPAQRMASGETTNTWTLVLSAFQVTIPSSQILADVYVDTSVCFPTVFVSHSPTNSNAMQHCTPMSIS